jgi:hypothetical protein
VLTCRRSAEPVPSVWSVDTKVAEDMLAVLALAGKSHLFPGDFGFQKEIETVWALWRKKTGLLAP